MNYTIEVNGLKRTVDVDGDMPLLWVLRDELDLEGQQVRLRRRALRRLHRPSRRQATRSCLTPISTVGEAAVATIEGMAADPVGRTLQAAWMELDVPQCGYCQAGQIMSATALLAKTPHPSDREIDDGDERQRLSLLHLFAHPRRDQESGAGPIDRARRKSMTIMTANRPARRAAVAHPPIPSRRIFLKASAAAGGGLLLQAMLPPLCGRDGGNLRRTRRRSRRRSTPSSASRPTASSRSCRRIRRSARASRRCCRW